MSDEKDDESPSEKSWLSEAVRELTATGLAAYFLTEDSVRGLLKEKKLPKELVSLLLDGVGKKKDDLLGVVGKEVQRVLNRFDLSREFEKMLETHDVHVDARISFTKKKKEGKRGSGSSDE